MEFKRIGIAADHAGFNKKEMIKKYLIDKGYEIKDYGTDSPEAADFPDFAHPLASAIEKGNHEVGISLCGSGNGINMTTNKYASIRAALCWNKEIARLARAHNDANICSLPARFISDAEAKEIVNVFLNTNFDGGRHLIRINKIPIK